VVYRSHYKRPQFPPKVDFGGPDYRLQASHVASHVDWPSRTLLKVRLAWQDAVLLRRMTTTALVYSTLLDSVPFVESSIIYINELQVIHVVVDEAGRRRFVLALRHAI